jgi:hypothetical protein
VTVSATCLSEDDVTVGYSVEGVRPQTDNDD